MQPGSRVEILQTLESWQGMVAGIVACSTCEAAALLRLLSWQGQHLEHRVFSIGALPADAATLYLRSLRNGSCDIGRGSAEFDALSSVAQIHAIGRFSISPLTCQDVVHTETLIQHMPWQNISPNPKESTWWSYFDQ